MALSPITFVLVHGAWHGGWCYSRVAHILRRAGHYVFTPTLTGLGERSHLYDPSIGLSTHIADIINVMTWERLSNVVLVGHSYGGMVITGVADRAAGHIDGLIYLDAFLPAPNQSLHDLIAMDAATAQINLAHGTTHNGIPPIPAELFNVNERDRSWVDSLCTPQPLPTFTEKLLITGQVEQIKRRTYIFATKNTLGGGFKAFRDIAAADDRWEVGDLDCGHDVMIDMPHETATILLQVGGAP